MKRAIVLCSGGLDSVVCAHYIRKKLSYTSINLLFFNYGQRTVQAERKAAKQCAHDIRATFQEILLPLAHLNVPLVSKSTKVKSSHQVRDTTKEHNAWYVPGRNTLFLAHAFSTVEKMAAKDKVDIFVGFKCEGKEPYPDTTPEYVSSINQLLHIAFKNITLLAPFITKDKEDIIALGNKLGVDFTKTISCYTSNNHCGSCLACRLRKQGFYWANVSDPTSYAP
jgi:7-cyano-7-deazaguanine synthase